MLAFQLSISGQPAGAFGFEDWSVLHAGRLNPAGEFELHTGALPATENRLLRKASGYSKRPLGPAGGVR